MRALKECLRLIRRHKFYFLLPLLLLLALLALVFLALGPSAVVSFIYAGL